VNRSLLVALVFCALGGVVHAGKRYRTDVHKTDADLHNELLLIFSCIRDDVESVRSALMAGADPNCSLQLPYEITFAEALRDTDVLARIRLLQEFVHKSREIYELSREVSIEMTQETFHSLQTDAVFFTPLFCTYVVGSDPEILQLLLAAGAAPVLTRSAQCSDMVDIRFVSDPLRVRVLIEAFGRGIAVRVPGPLLSEDGLDSPAKRARRMLGAWQPPRSGNLLSPVEMFHHAFYVNRVDRAGIEVDKRTESAKLLLCCGMVNCNMINEFKKTLDMYIRDPTCRALLLKRLRIFVDAGLPLDLPDDGGRTAFHYAAQFGDEDLLIFFLESNADPLAEDNGGDTPLQTAIRYNHIGAGFLWECFKLQPRVHLYHRFANGKTLFGEATDAGVDELISYMVTDRGFDLASPYNTKEPNSPTSAERLRQKYGTNYFNFREVLPLDCIKN
jgi:hypothetical protein